MKYTHKGWCEAINSATGQGLLTVFDLGIAYYIAQVHADWDTGKGVWKSKTGIAKDLNCDRSTVITSFKKLKDLGFIFEVAAEPGRSVHYDLVMPEGVAETDRGVAYTYRGVSVEPTGVSVLPTQTSNITTNSNYEVNLEIDDISYQGEYEEKDAAQSAGASPERLTPSSSDSSEGSISLDSSNESFNGYEHMTGVLVSPTPMHAYQAREYPGRAEHIPSVFKLDGKKMTEIKIRTSVGSDW